jgi:hypothetical protein
MSPAEGLQHIQRRRASLPALIVRTIQSYYTNLVRFLFPKIQKACHPSAGAVNWGYVCALLQFDRFRLPEYAGYIGAKITGLTVSSGTCVDPKKQLKSSLALQGTT